MQRRVLGTTVDDPEMRGVGEDDDDGLLCPAGDDLE
jgi:hypothetical protein